jgi:toxin ParE1/3/4
MRQNQNRSWRLTPAAVRDLEGIWSFTAERWSVSQADQYLKSLIVAIESLLQNPAIARERVEFVPPVRIQSCRSHVIIFRDEGDHLNIIRVRHGSEDWASDPDVADRN